MGIVVGVGGGVVLVGGVIALIARSRRCRRSGGQKCDRCQNLWPGFN
ncbi:hypothetical protein [Nostoc flagelliforme]|nr:hypothetical protein [Nostoc flagelliforme]